MNAIEISNLTKSFNTANGLRQVLKNISLNIIEDSCTIISGENGSGKSLLMNIIAGLEDYDNGNLIVNGKVGLVFQEAETQILGETPQEDIAFGPKNLGWKKDKINQSVSDALEKTGLTEKKEFAARFLSGGEKRRLAVACMLAMDLPIIIMDEPYANLDFGGVKQVNQLIKNLRQQQKTVLILTHEIEKCLGLADKFIVLFRGEKVYDGDTKNISQIDLEQWNIRNPFVSYNSVSEMVW